MNKRGFTGFLLLVLLLTGCLATTVFAKTTDASKPQTYKTAKTYIHYRSKPVQENTNYFITSKLRKSATGTTAPGSAQRKRLIRILSEQAM